ncbi:hypothetical protein [Qipengyuania oceanensis]
MELIRSVTSRDGKYRIDFERDADGFYRYVTFNDRYRDHEDFHNPPFWTIAKFSGLYDTTEAVEADARSEFSWLRE